MHTANTRRAMAPSAKSVTLVFLHISVEETDNRQVETYQLGERQYDAEAGGRRRQAIRVWCEPMTSSRDSYRPWQGSRWYRVVKATHLA